MKNLDVRKAIGIARVYYWEVANALGMSDGQFSRKLRKELSAKEKVRILDAISKAKEKSDDSHNANNQ